MTGWGEARAYVIWETVDASGCFCTKAEMEAYIAKVNDEINSGARQVSGEIGILAT